MARRTRGRRVRRSTRFTPRRWLPFVALVAVAAAVVVAGREVVETEPDAPTVARPAAELPVAAEADALSTAWYCAGGTAVGPSGPAELVATVSNADGRGATAEVTAVGPGGRTERTTVDVPAHGRVAVTASELLEADWAALTVEVLGGRAAVERFVTGPTGFDRTPCSSTASDTWYVPSGSTLRGSTEHLVLFNPFADDTSVDVTFATDQGARSPRALQGLPVPARSLRVVDVSRHVSESGQIASVVRARSGRIVVDRVQRHDGEGDPVGEGDLATPAPHGLVATSAIPTTSDRWLFPHAERSPGGRTRLVVHNPSRREARLDVTVAYERPERQPPIDPLALDVRAGEQAVLDLTEVLEIPDLAPFSLDVRSIEGVPVVAELVVDGATPPLPPAEAGTGDGDATGDAAEESPEEGAEEAPPEAAEPGRPEPVDGAAVTAGSPVASSAWFVPTRGAGSTLATSVVVHNPGAAPVTVEVVELDQGNRVPLDGATVDVPPGDRRVVDLSGAELRSGLLVTADGPVVVGRTVVTTSGLGITTALAMPLPGRVVPIPPG